MHAETDTPPSRAASVLVVEDELGIVDFLRRGLQAEGFAVEVATNGIDGERANADLEIMQLLPTRGAVCALEDLRERAARALGSRLAPARRCGRWPANITKNS